MPVGSRVAGGRHPDGGQSDDVRVTRTCIGCRQRGTATDLLRVVAGPAVSTETGSPVSSMNSMGPLVEVLPDPRRRATGRGAWLHPVIGCVELAERRRAFGRALRITARLDASPVRKYVESVTGS